MWRFGTIVPRYNDTYGTDEPNLVNQLRGYLCKPATLLAADMDVVTVVDLDVIVVDSPFQLMATPAFRTQG